MAVLKIGIEFARFIVKVKTMPREMSTKCALGMNPAEYHLSTEQKAFYSDNGYLVIKTLFDLKTLDNLRKRFRDICNGKVETRSMSIIKERDLVSANSNAEDYINKVQDILHDEVFISYSEDPRLLHIVSQFIGEGITALNSMLINKPPGSTRHPPHQDSKKFFHVISNEEQHAPVDQRLFLELNPGDTCLFHPCLIHGSEANMSKSYRKSMIVHYMNSGCEYIDLSGTAQESVLHDYKIKVQKKGLPNSYQELWKLKSKEVKGVSCHL